APNVPHGVLGGVQLHPARFDLRKVEHVVDEAEQMPAIGLDVKEWLLEVGREISIDAIEKEFGEAEDRIHGSPELVAHAGQEVRFRLARPFEPSIERPELLRALPLLLIETLERLSNRVHVGAQRAELIPIR